MGVTWQFSSSSNRDVFAGDPQGYAPQYGGYCAFAVSKAATAPGDPEVWTIHDGKLYLNVSKSVRKHWMQDVKANIVKADKYWPKIKGVD